MSVMTGAAAAALYGSEAANGAVLITTKKGRGRAVEGDPSSQQSSWSRFGCRSSRTATARAATANHGFDDPQLGPTPSETIGPHGYTPEEFSRNGPCLYEFRDVSGGTERNQTYFSAAAVNSDGSSRTTSTTATTSRSAIRRIFDDRLTLDVGGQLHHPEDRNMTNQGVYSNPLVSAYLFPRGMISRRSEIFERWDPARKITCSTGRRARGRPAYAESLLDCLPQPARYGQPHRLHAVGLGELFDILDWLDVSGRIAYRQYRLGRTRRSSTPRPTPRSSKAVRRATIRSQREAAPDVRRRDGEHQQDLRRSFFAGGTRRRLDQRHAQPGT